jgi:hypothetical protein
LRQALAARSMGREIEQAMWGAATGGAAGDQGPLCADAGISQRNRDPTFLRQALADAVRAVARLSRGKPLCSAPSWAAWAARGLAWLAQQEYDIGTVPRTGSAYARYDVKFQLEKGIFVRRTTRFGAAYGAFSSKRLLKIQE